MPRCHGVYENNLCMLDTITDLTWSSDIWASVCYVFCLVSMCISFTCIISFNLCTNWIHALKGMQHLIWVICIYFCSLSIVVNAHKCFLVEIDCVRVQRVDLHIPEIPVVGGYSITHDPHTFATSRQLGLAIQYSDHAPTYWMHTKVLDYYHWSKHDSWYIAVILAGCVQCQVGSCLNIRIGGDFTYNPTPSKLSDLLLVAGGIGINPVMSMLLHQVHLSGHAHLLYSAKNCQELIFKVRNVKYSYCTTMYWYRHR